MSDSDAVRASDEEREAAVERLRTASAEGRLTLEELTTRTDEPKRQLLQDLLDSPRYPEGRYLETLCLYTGTTPEECRRLLNQIKARGIKLQDGEGWALIKNMPFDKQ